MSSVLLKSASRDADYTCLSAAPDAYAVKRIHERAGHPTDLLFAVPVQA